MSIGRVIGGTALIVASEHGHLDVVQALLAKGAYVNAKDNYGRTALDAAGKIADVRALLVQAGAKTVTASTHLPRPARKDA